MADRVAHYIVLERLGWGALGDVFRARDTKVGRTVALMQPPAALVSDAGRRARFLEDARAAMALNHPNVAALFDVVEQDGRCYLAYEFAAGPSLGQEMAGVRLGVRRSVEIAAQIADALAEGHGRGIVHGDLRPDTVVVTPKGSTKILNFGMVPWTAGGTARRLAAVSPDALNADEAIVAAYLSPEQALGGSTDERSDLFSLGGMLCEMLTARHPFRAPTVQATVLNVIQSRAPAPSGANADVPPALDALLSRTLAKDIAARPLSAAALASELRAVAVQLDTLSGDRGPATLIPLDEEQGHGWVGIGAGLTGAALLAWWLFG